MKYVYECLKMGHDVSDRMHFDFWSDFAFNVIQTYRIK